MLSRKIAIGCWVALLAGSGWAVEFPDSKLIKAELAKVTFESQGKEHTLRIGSEIKFYGRNGKELPTAEGIGMLVPGNIVQIVASEEDAAKGPQIVFMRLIDGELPTAKAVDLLPDPDFKGEIGKGSVPQDWVDYFPTAKVGDFAEHKGFGRVRREVLAVDSDSITVARVVDTGGTRHEFREKLTLSKAQKDHLKKSALGEDEKQPKPKTAKTKTTKPKSKQRLTAAQKKALKAKEEREAAQAKAKAEREAAQAKAKEPAIETLTIDGEELECQVEKGSGTAKLWTSDRVPFDGVVKRRSPNDNIDLVKFGRAK